MCRTALRIHTATAETTTGSHRLRKGIPPPLQGIVAALYPKGAQMGRCRPGVEGSRRAPRLELPASGRRVEAGVEAEVDGRLERQGGDGTGGDPVGVEDQEGALPGPRVEALADHGSPAVVGRIGGEGRLSSQVDPGR